MKVYVHRRQPELKSCRAMIVALLDVDPGTFSTLTSATITDGGCVQPSRETRAVNFVDDVCRP